MADEKEAQPQELRVTRLMRRAVRMAALTVAMAFALLVAAGLALRQPTWGSLPFPNGPRSDVERRW